jgi:hypothetical protein
LAQRAAQHPRRGPRASLEKRSTASPADTERASAHVPGIDRSDRPTVVHNLRMCSVGNSLETQKIEGFEIKGVWNIEQSLCRDSDRNRIRSLFVYISSCLVVLVLRHVGEYISVIITEICYAFAWARTGAPLCLHPPFRCHVQVIRYGRPTRDKLPDHITDPSAKSCFCAQTIHVPIRLHGLGTCYFPSHIHIGA